MKTVQIHTAIIVSLALMSSPSIQASANEAEVYARHSMANKAFDGQWAHCKIEQTHFDNNKDKGVISFITKEKRFLRIILAPHIPTNTSTPTQQTERYLRLDNAQYRLENNRIDVHGLNDDSLSIRIKKIKDNSVILSAHQRWPRCLKNEVYWEHYYPFKQVAEQDLQPGMQLNFKAAQLRKVLDGKSLPRWVLEITIPIDKNEHGEVQKDTGKPEWKQIPRQA